MMFRMLDSWLLSDEHPIVRHSLQTQLAQHFADRGDWSDALLAGGGYTPNGSAPRKRRKVSRQWVELHASMAEGRNQDWWTSGIPSQRVLESSPGLLQLTDREFDMLKLLEVPVPDPLSRHRCVDISESAPRAVRAGTGSRHISIISSCVTPVGKRYLPHRARLVHPVEDMRLQCLFLPRAR